MWSSIWAAIKPAAQLFFSTLLKFTFTKIVEWWNSYQRNKRKKAIQKKIDKAKKNQDPMNKLDDMQDVADDLSN